MPPPPASTPLWAACALTALTVLSYPAHAGTVRTFTGDNFEGDVRFENGAVTVTVKGQPVQRIDLSNVLRADFLNKKADAVGGAGPGVQLRNGTVIGSKLAGLDATAAHMMVDGHPLDFPLANVARVMFAPLPDAVAAAIPPGFIGAILPGGDLFEGEYRGMDERPPQVKVNSPFLGVHRFGLNNREILAISFHDVAAAAPEAYRIRTADGSAYVATSLQPAGDSLTLRDQLAGDVKIPARQLTRIMAGPARVLPIGSLRAQTVGSVNPAKVPAVFMVDALGSDNPILLVGQSYDDGIVQAAGVAVTYAIPPGFSIFTAQTGLLTSAAAGAEVTFTLLVDGHAVWQSQPVATGDLPLPVRWKLGGGARTLTLAVEPTHPAFLGVPGAWADAALLKP